jgi:fructokinase
MITVIGEVLIDEFPAYSRIGGAPFNFAANVHRLDEPVRLITRIGADQTGSRIATEIRRLGLDASGLQTDSEKSTGRVRVALTSDGDHRFDILPDAAFDRIQPADPAPDTQMVYFGTLAQRTASGFAHIQHFIESQPKTALRMLDINLRPGGWTRNVIEQSLAQADILKLNDEEWEVIRSMLSPETPSEGFGAWLMRRFDLDLIALTRGAAGAELLTVDGKHYRMASPAVASIVDTVGAGDGFAAVLAVGLIRQRPLKQVLRAATDFAAAVCEFAGALPADSRVYRAAAETMGDGDNER